MSKNKLEYINIATKRYYRNEGYKLKEAIKEALYEKFLNRLSKYSPEYCFGFTGFKPSEDGKTFVGTMLCSVDGNRFFGCHLPRIGKSARPFEYKKGEEFTITPDEVFSGDDFLTEFMAFDVIQYSTEKTYKALVKYVIENVQS